MNRRAVSVVEVGVFLNSALARSENCRPLLRVDRMAMKSEMRNSKCNPTLAHKLRSLFTICTREARPDWVADQGRADESPN
jgi:hypothetical protein